MSRIALLLRRASLAGCLPGAARLRPLVAVLALTVALASFLHAVHSGHEADGHGVARICAFCASFERASPPAAPALMPRAARPVPPEQLPIAAPRPPAAPASFRSRAPPRFQA